MVEKLHSNCCCCCFALTRGFQQTASFQRGKQSRRDKAASGCAHGSRWSMARYAFMPTSGVRRHVVRWERNLRGRAWASNLFVWLPWCRGGSVRQVIQRSLQRPYTIAWRKSGNHPSAPNTKLSSCMVMLWTCLSKTSTLFSITGCRRPRQTPVAPCAEPRLTSCWLPRLAAEMSPQPPNGQVPQSHLQLIQQPLLRRTVGWPRFLRDQLGTAPQSTSRPAHSPALPRSPPW